MSSQDSVSQSRSAGEPTRRLVDRLSVRALRMALDPASSRAAAAHILGRMADGNRTAVAQALARLQRRHGDRPGPAGRWAAAALRDALSALDQASVRRVASRNPGARQD